ncbi:hypothetical protein GCM10020295_16270 [Streptomyces cinereospinus]
MVDTYGLTSLNKLVFMMAVCDGTGAGLSHFTEEDIARMRTLRDVVDALEPYVGKAA